MTVGVIERAGRLREGRNTGRERGRASRARVVAPEGCGGLVTGG